MYQPIKVVLLNQSVHIHSKEIILLQRSDGYNTNKLIRYVLKKTLIFGGNQWMSAITTLFCKI